MPRNLRVGLPQTPEASLGSDGDYPIYTHNLSKLVGEMSLGDTVEIEQPVSEPDYTEN